MSKRMKSPVMDIDINWVFEAIKLAREIFVVSTVVFSDDPFSSFHFWEQLILTDKIARVTSLSPESTVGFFS